MLQIYLQKVKVSPFYLNFKVILSKSVLPSNQNTEVYSTDK